MNARVIGVAAAALLVAVLTGCGGGVDARVKREAARIYGSSAREVKSVGSGDLTVVCILDSPPAPQKAYEMLVALHAIRPDDAFVEEQVIYPEADGRGAYYVYSWLTTGRPRREPGTGRLREPNSVVVSRGTVSRPAAGLMVNLTRVATITAASDVRMAALAEGRVPPPQEVLRVTTPQPSGPFDIGVPVLNGYVETLVTSAVVSPTGVLVRHNAPSGRVYVDVSLIVRPVEREGGVGVPPRPAGSLLTSVSLEADGAQVTLLDQRVLRDERLLEFEIPSDAKTLQLVVQVPDGTNLFRLR